MSAGTQRNSTEINGCRRGWAFGVKIKMPTLCNGRTGFNNRLSLPILASCQHRTWNRVVLVQVIQPLAPLETPIEFLTSNLS